MSDTAFPHFSTVHIDGIAFDRRGIGWKPAQGDGGAFWAMVKPSIFLALATPLERPRPSLVWLAERVAEGSPISAPELLLRRTPKGSWAVDSHEGRHRATLLRTLREDRAVPVRFCVRDLGWDEVDDAVIRKVRSGLRAQRGRPEVKGPLFGEAEVDLGGVRFRVRGPPSGGCGPMRRFWKSCARGRVASWGPNGRKEARRWARP